MDEKVEEKEEEQGREGVRGWGEGRLNREEEAESTNSNEHIHHVDFMFNSHGEVSEREHGRALQFFNIHYFRGKSWSFRGAPEEISTNAVCVNGFQ